MGTLTFRIVNPGDPPFADQSMLDTCVDPQFNGVFPDDPGLGIVSERKANATSSHDHNQTRFRPQEISDSLDERARNND